MKTKVLRVATFCLLLTAVTAAAGLWYLRRLSQRELVRTERLATELKSLRIGQSTYHEARAIAERYGTVHYENELTVRDCAAGYFERCDYHIRLRSPSMNRVFHRLPFAQRLGIGNWLGSAHIFIDQGKVVEHSFSLLFKTSDGEWRGSGTEESKSLPERAVAARLSDSYLVSRNDVVMYQSPGGLGYSLDSTLTPQANESERARAWHYDFSCLEQTSGCNEICNVLPDAWRDFYSLRGRFDVQKFGSRYAFCTKSAFF
jgi:hypothetical protein